jgi:hypothetical protein
VVSVQVSTTWAVGRRAGWYLLLTSLEPAAATTAEVVPGYKGQKAVERRYGAFKGPLAAAPRFLKNNRRTTAPASVIRWALLTFCLVKRAVRPAPSHRVRGPRRCIGHRGAGRYSVEVEGLG